MVLFASRLLRSSPSATSSIDSITQALSTFATLAPYTCVTHGADSRMLTLASSVAQRPILKTASYMRLLGARRLLHPI